MTPLSLKALLDSDVVNQKLQKKQQQSNEVQEHYDPYQGLSHLQKVKVDHDLSNSQISPFNQSDFTQVIVNPIVPNGAEQIAVQLFQYNVKLQNKDDQTLVREHHRELVQRQFQSVCLQNHILNFSTFSNYLRKYCFYCEKYFEYDQNIYQCLECIEDEEFIICQPCNLKYYTRHHLVHAASQHNFYQEYELVAVSENENEDLVPAKLKKQQNSPKNDPDWFLLDQKRLNEINQKLSILDSNQTKKANSFEFACLKRVNEQLYSHENKLNIKKYAILSLMRTEQNGVKNCYRTFKVFNPCFQKIKQNDKQTEQKLLHYCEDAQKNICDVIYFTKNTDCGAKSISCNYIDLKQATLPEQNLQKIDSINFMPPLKKSIKIQPDNYLIQLFFKIFCKQEYKVSQKAPIQIINIGSKEILVITCNFALNTDQNLWVENYGIDNLIFINMTTMTLEFIAYNAEILVDYTHDKNGIKSIKFFRNSSIIEMEWNSVLFFEDGMNESLDYSSPKQIETRSYNMMVSPDNKMYRLQMDQLNKQLADNQDNSYTKICKVHSNNTRITFCFQDGGVFTFELQDKVAFQNPSKWFGSIGEQRDFQMHNFKLIGDKITANGEDFRRGKFNVIGKAQMNNKTWNGYFKQNNFAYKIKFDSVYESDGNNVYGCGTDWQDKEFEIIDHKGGNGKVSWTLNYKETKQKQFYWGQFNQDKSKIQGSWGFKENVQIGDFEMVLERLYKIQLRIQYENTDNSWMTLEGFLSLDSSTIYGTFETSEDLYDSITGAKNARQTNEFDFIAHEYTDRAVLVFNTDGMDSSRFVKVSSKSSKGSLHIVGGLVLKNQITNWGYIRSDLTLINLDAVDPSLEENQCTVAVQLPATLYDIENSDGTKSLPYYVMMEYVVNDTNPAELRFANQMIFFDQSLNCRRLVFLEGYGSFVPQGQQKNTGFARNTSSIQRPQNKELDLLIPTCAAVMSENYDINFPVLMYKTDLLNNQQLAISNLANNTHQKFVNIAPFQFVQTLLIGYNPERHLDENSKEIAVNISSFLIVEYQEKYRVMVYRTFPWAVDPLWIDPDQLFRFQLQDQIQLLSGYIDLKIHKKYFEPKNLMFDKIQVASMITRVANIGIEIMIVFQLENQIVCFILNKPDFIQRVHGDNPQKKMLKFQLQRSEGEEIYFANEDTRAETQEIVQLSFIEKGKATQNIVYTSENAKILAFQLIDIQNSKFPDILVLDDEKKIKRLRNSTKIVSDFKIDLVISLHANPKINNLLQNLKKVIWQNTILTEDFVVALIQEEESLQSMVFSSKCEMNVKNQIIGFQDDEKHFYMQRNLHYDKGICQVLSLNEIPYIGKDIYIVQEGKKNFFLIQNQFGRRSIDLMREDTKESFRESQILLGNSYIGFKLKFTNQYLLYSQLTLDFVESYPSQLLIPITFVKNGVQYFASLDKMIDLQGKTEDEVIKIDQAEKTVIFSNLKQYTRFVMEKYLQPCQIYDVDSQDFIFQHDNDHLLGIIAWAYPEEAYAMNEQQQSFHNGNMDISVIMIKDIAQAMYNLNENKNDRFIQSEKNQSQTIIVIKCDYWQEITGQETRQVILTSDYFVIKHGMLLCFARLEDVEQTNFVGFRTPENFKSAFDSGDCKVKFRLFNMNHLTNYIVKDDFKIQEVDQFELDVAEKGEQRNNVIQISFSDLCIMWDFDEDKEVTFLNQPLDFSTVETYIPTGFVPFMFKDPDNPHMSQAVRFTFNEDRSLVITSEIQSESSQLFRQYSLINLLEVIDIQEKFKQSLEVNVVNIQTMIQNFNGMTFFQVFRDQYKFFEYLEQQLESLGLLDQIFDEFGQPTDNIILRQIFWSFSQPVVKEGISDNALKQLATLSILQVAIFEEDKHYLLNSYLRLIMLSDEFRLSNLVVNFNCFQQIMQIQSNQIQKFLEECLFENKETLSVKALMWNPGDTMITFSSQNSLLNQVDIAEEIRGEQLKRMGIFKKIQRWFNPQADVFNDLQTFTVRVRILELEWVADSLVELYEFLAKIDDNQIFGNELIKILLEQQNYTGQLMIKVLFPWIVMVILNLFYFTYYLPSVPVGDAGFFGTKYCYQVNEIEIICRSTLDQVIIRILILILMTFFMFTEIQQILKNGFNYLGDFWNFVFWINQIICYYIIFAHGTKSDIQIETLMQISSINILVQWMLVFYWLRLFSELGFYVNLILQTLVDIGYFLVMLLVLIFAFGNALFVLNQITHDPETLNTAYTLPGGLWLPAFNNSFFDSLENQYLISLGQFDFSNYANHPANILITLYFIFATFLAQITFMNMLIAIMGKTFHEVTEQKERAALMERSHMYADFLWGIKLTSELKGQRYLYVVRPQPDNEEEDVISAVTQAKDKILQLIKDESAKSNEDIQNLHKKVNLLMESQNKMNGDLNTKFESINTKFDLIMAKMK